MQRANPNGLEPRRRRLRLDLAGPVRLGLTTLAIVAGGFVVLARTAPVETGATLSGLVTEDAQPHAIRHVKGGVAGQVYVRNGDLVGAGQVLLALDTIAIDGQIAALKAQSDAARRQLTLIRLEAVAMGERARRQDGERSAVLALERQVGEVERELAGIANRISTAEHELAAAVIRAPIAGRVTGLAVLQPGAVAAPGVTIVEIVPSDGRLVVDARLTPALMHLARPGQSARIWVLDGTKRAGEPISARLVSVARESIEDKRTGLLVVPARFALDTAAVGSAGLTAGQRTEVHLQTGTRTILDQMLEPVIRNLHRIRA